MGFFDAFKTKGSGKPSVTKVDEVTERDCPYCGQPISPVPSRKKKCPHCKKDVHVRTQYETGERLLFTDTQISQFDREKESYYDAKQLLDGLKMHTEIDDSLVDSLRVEMQTELTKRFGTKASYGDVAWAVSNRIMIEKRTMDIANHIHFQQALFMHRSGKNYFYIREKDFENDLKRYRKTGVTKVEICTAGEQSCSNCRALEGKMSTVEEALREKILPCKQCTHDLNASSVGWCRCLYLSKFD